MADSTSLSSRGEQLQAQISERIQELDQQILERDQQISSKKRFHEELIDSHQFVEMNKNTNTKRKTSGDVRLFKKFISELNGIAYENEDDLSLIDFTPAALDNFLARFFMVLTKADGGEYEPDTLTSIHGSVFRHLRDQGIQPILKPLTSLYILEMSWQVEGSC